MIKILQGDVVEKLREFFRFTGIEINPEYVKIARERLRLNEQLVTE